MGRKKLYLNRRTICVPEYDFSKMKVVGWGIYAERYRSGSNFVLLDPDVGHISRFTSIAGATGLDLSISSLRNLKHVIAGNERLEKLNPTGLDENVFMEVLGVDSETANRLSRFFYLGNEVNGLDEIESITKDTIAKVKEHFIVQEP
jgi:hypothetical protein